MSSTIISNHNSVTESYLGSSKKESEATTQSKVLSSVSSVNSRGPVDLSAQEKENIHSSGNQESDNNISPGDCISRNISDQHDVKKECIVTTPSLYLTGDARSLFNSLTASKIPLKDLNIEEGGRARKTVMSLLGIFVSFVNTNSSGYTSEEIDRIIEKDVVKFSKHRGMSGELKKLLATSGHDALNHFVEEFNLACDEKWQANNPGNKLTGPQEEQYCVNKKFCNLYANDCIDGLTSKKLSQLHIQMRFNSFRAAFLALASSVGCGYNSIQDVEKPLKNPVGKVGNNGKNGLNFKSAQLPYVAEIHTPPATPATPATPASNKLSDRSSPVIRVAAEVHPPPSRNKISDISYKVPGQGPDTADRGDTEVITADQMDSNKSNDAETEEKTSKNMNHKQSALEKDENQWALEMVENQKALEIFSREDKLARERQAKLVRDEENYVLDIRRGAIKEFDISGNLHQSKLKSPINSGGN